MSVPTLIRSFTAAAAIGQNRIVHVSAAEQVSQSAAATAAMVGVCVQPGGAAAGAPCDVALEGIAEVVAGAAISVGALVTADAQGRAIAASAAAGANIRVLGVALEPATAAGDIIPVLLSQGSFQG